MSKKLLTFLTLLTLFFGVGWAAEGDVHDMNITQATVLNNSTAIPSVNIDAQSYPIKAVTINWSYNKTINNPVTIEVKVGGISWGSQTVTGKTTADAVFEGMSTTGAVDIIFTNNTGSGTGHGTFYINSVKLTEGSGGSTTTVGPPSISFSSFTAGNTTTIATITPGTNATSTSYKIGENGTYATYSQPIEFDLTQVASPITVYAKSSAGTDDSDETSATFTLPALGVSVSSSTYSGYTATVTITPTNYVGTPTITYTDNGGSPINYSTPFTVTAVGTHEIIATVSDERANGSSVTSSAATIEILETPGYNLPFVETFADAAGTGPSGDYWGGSIASAGFKSDNEGWSYNSGYAGAECARFGSGNANGYATTPTIKGFTAGSEYNLTFKAGAWNGDGTTLSLTASNGTFKDKTTGNAITSVTMLNNAWTDYEVIFVPSATTSTITFATNSKRFFLDEVNVTAPSTTVEDGYYLFGQFNNWATGDSNYKFTQQSDGSYKLTVSNYTANNQYKFAKYVNGSATLIGVDNSGDNYGLHSTHHTNIAMNTGNDTYSINDSGEMIFTIHADETAYDVDKQVYMKGTYNEWANEAMTLTADGWTITKQLAADAELGFVDSWGSGIWHGCADNNNNLTVDQSKLDTDLALWTDGKNFYFPTAGNYSFTVSRDLSKVVISLVPESYAINCTATPEGTGTVTADKETATAGETVTLTVTPANSNYEVISVTVNDVKITPENGVYSFEMPAGVANVVATFAKIQYTIIKAATNCTISITEIAGEAFTGTDATAGAGDVVKFTVTPVSSKYTIKSVTVTWSDGTTGTVQLTNNGDGNYQFNMVAHPITITAVCEREAVGDGSFVLVTDASTLKAGDKVIITNSKTVGSAEAMGADRGNNRGVAAVNITEDLKITPGADAQILTLESSTVNVEGEGTINAWMFNAGEGYLYAASSGSNYLKTGDVTTANAKATITLGNDGNAIITFKGDNTRNIIRYNSNNNPHIFSCYASGQSDVYIYKQTAAGLMVDIDPAGGEVIGSQEVVIDANVEGAMVQYKIGDGEWSTPAAAPVTTTITGNVGDEVIVYAKATLENDGETLEDEASATFTFVAPAAPTITPATCAISSETQRVTINAGEYTNATVEYSIDGGTTWNTYSGPFNVVVEGFGESVTVQARVTVNGVTSEVAAATYTRGVQPVVFSPASGTYYDDQTCQMFSTSKNARIYYTTDGSEPSKTNGTLYTDEVSMPATGTYQFKAVAYIGNTASTVSSANYNIRPRSEGTGYNENYLLFNVAELNAMKNSFPSGTYQTDGSYTMVNPVQVVWMSTYKNVTNGYPEYCLIRDNTGYGMIYFGKNNSSHAGYKIFDMGDWISGGYNGKVSLAYSQDHGQLDTHPELGASGSTGKKIYQWPESALSNASVLPEYITIPEILASETPGNIDYWGHYVHLRKNTVQLIASDDPGTYTTGQDKDGKWSGTITDENGNQINYYDKFYLQIDSTWTTTSNFFTGHPNRTFDIYGFVACHLPAEIDYQIAPFAFAWIDQPICDHETGTYTSEQTVKITSPNDPEATIWYKTSEMDDYHVYTGPITVNSTTTIEWYATKQSQYNDVLESKKGEITMTFQEIPVPVITPESEVFAVGSSVDASIAFADGVTVPDGTVIRYTIDGSDPNSADALTYVVGETTLHFTATTTVRAIAELGGIYSAEAESKTYTFVKSNGIVYDLVTNVNQITENGIYVIVNQNYNEAMSNVQGETNRGASGVMFVENTNKGQVYGNDDLAIFTVKEGNHEGEFLFETHNSNVNGFLCVESENNNTLLTEAEMDAMGNDVAVVTIDADGRAHIRYNYSGGDNRYLQYWNRDRYFTTYKTEDADRAVYIYYKNATPLASIEKEGVVGNQYTIADELIAVHYVDPNEGEYKYLWCKDQGNVSISKTEKNEGQTDYLREVAKVQGEWSNNTFESRDWDQSNWVVLKFETNDAASISNAVGKFIKPASITGHYTDDVNFTITMPAGQGLPADVIGGDAGFTPNVYCPANFLDANLNIGDGEGPAGTEPGERYFFMNPKIQEVATVTFAVWNGTCFVVPAKDDNNNHANVAGAFSVDWSLNKGGNVTAANANEMLRTDVAYKFLSVLNTVSGSKAGSEVPNVSPSGSTPQGNKVVYPLNLNGGENTDNIVTAIKDVVDVTGKAVAGVKYYNLAGIESNRPFDGVNIIVTTYTDGSRTSAKVLK